MTIDEKYIFTAKGRKAIFITLLVGLVLTALGILAMNMGGHHGGEHAAAESGGHAAFHWTARLYANLWINNLYFTGLAIVGVFFIAIQYVAKAGWSVGFKRIAMAMASWLPIAAILMVVIFLIANHDLFHWTHEYLYDPSDPRYDPILAGKKGYLNFGFYMARMMGFFAVWYLLFILIRKQMLAEDLEGGTKRWKKNVTLSAIFIVFFGYSSSVASWDWVMSIDPHWFSTMFGWYVFASWWVSGLALIAFIAVLLKGKGYLSIINANHLHDIGKFVWGFSIFWTYIWFSQFLLIYYANIPEESIYFVERFLSDKYSGYFFINLILNFFLPFLLLMPRDAKRHTRFIKIVCPIILFGHWIDFYLMVTPGTLKENGGFGALEVGLLVVYASLFVYTALYSLAKYPLVAKHHPMLEEAIHHHV